MYYNKILSLVELDFYLWNVHVSNIQLISKMNYGRTKEFFYAVYWEVGCLELEQLVRMFKFGKCLIIYQKKILWHPKSSNSTMIQLHCTFKKQSMKQFIFLCPKAACQAVCLFLSVSQLMGLTSSSV